MMIRSALLIWAVIQIFISGSQSKPQATPNGDPQFCSFLEENKCQEAAIKTQCTNLCKPKDAVFCTHISPDKCTEAFIRRECSQMCSRQAIECGSYAAVSHILSIDERIRDASSSSILKDLGGIAALYKSTTELRSLNHICGAILISEWHLLTAAHCLVEHDSFSISLGQEDLNESTEPGGDTYEIAKTIIHPRYDRSASSYHDIALLVTDRRVNFKDTIWPFCLPNSQQTYEDYTFLQIAGWGKVDAKNKANTIKSEFVQLIKRSRCEEIWIQNAPDIYNQTVKYDYQEGLTQNILCAGRNGVDACGGDSGGPMTHQNTNGVKTAIGVISRGIGGCPKFPILPAYYTNIIEYLDWIYDNIGNSRVSLQNPTSSPKPVDEWSPWSLWGGCSTSCGDGQRLRTRMCTSLSRIPDNCAGNASEITNCNFGKCPGNGGNTGECPSPWFRIHQECFLAVFENSEWRHWIDARIYCGTQSTGADLAQPTDIKALSDYLVDNGYPSWGYWLGGGDQIVEGVYKWISGDLVPTNAWFQGAGRIRGNLMMKMVARTASACTL